jgi:hypothetical protein
MINLELQSMFSDLKQVNKATVVVKVEMNPSQLVGKLAKCYLDELHRVSGYMAVPEIDDLEVEDIMKYLYTLTWMRVCHCVSPSDPNFAKYKRIYRRIAVPVLAYQYNLCIGEATDRDFSIKFVPEFTIEANQLFSPEEMVALSDIMIRQQNNGFKIVNGLPNEVDGELDFMAMCHVGQEVLSYRKTHPVYAFMASFFEQQKLNDVTGMMCRVLYGYDTDYELFLSRIVSSIGGGDR